MATAWRTYPGYAYRQTADDKGSWLISFVAPAEELLEWAGIPRRTEAEQTGFQRIENDDRIQRAKAYFNLPPNQSPTALIVGIHPPAKGMVRRIELNLSSSANGRFPIPCELRILDDPAQLDTAHAVDVIRHHIDTRLEAEPEEEDEVGESGDVAAQSEEEEDETAFTREEGMEFTHSVLAEFRQHLLDTAWVEANKDTIADFAKPATIIDGQHRLLGAAACERQIPFAVIALYDCSWPEQVFQFTVVNYAAQGIPDQFITANAALSLTEGELRDLETRLVQADVKVIEYELMRVVQFDPRSPFYNLVNLSEGKDATKIGYKTMVRVARDWYSASIDVLEKNLIPALFPEIKGKGAARMRLERWRKGGVWAEFFLDFWNVVHDEYLPHKSDVGTSLWTVGSSNLMVAIVLFEFQRAFFQDLNNQDEDEFWAVPSGQEPLEFLRQKVKARAQKFVAYFPPEFFAKKWGMPSLNISSGRRALKGALSGMLQKKGKYGYWKSALFTGEVD